MITDQRLQWLSGPDYIGSEPGQIAAELLAGRKRIAALEKARDLSAIASATMRDESIAKNERIAALEAALKPFVEDCIRTEHIEAARALLTASETKGDGNG